MARVVDRDGATLGVATLEDVIEELVGEIRDAAHREDRAHADRPGSTVATWCAYGATKVASSPEPSGQDSE